MAKSFWMYEASEETPSLEKAISLKAIAPDTTQKEWDKLTLGMKRAIVKECLARGYTVSLYDGEEWTVKLASHKTTILNAMATTGEDTIRIRDDKENNLGFFSLIYGNNPDGTELIADFSDNEICDSIWKTVNP